MKIEGI